MYGRPEAWVWDPRNPISLMFAYPVGPNKDVSLYGPLFMLKSHFSRSSCS
jgi:hypothetical protein